MLLILITIILLYLPSTKKLKTFRAINSAVLLHERYIVANLNIIKFLIDIKMATEITTIINRKCSAASLWIVVRIQLNRDNAQPIEKKCFLCKYSLCKRMGLEPRVGEFCLSYGCFLAVTLCVKANLSIEKAIIRVRRLSTLRLLAAAAAVWLLPHAVAPGIYCLLGSLLLTRCCRRQFPINANFYARR